MNDFWKWVRIAFQPWPIRPLPLAVMLTLFQLLVNSAIVIASARSEGRFTEPFEIFATFPSVILGFITAISSLSLIKFASEKYPRFNGWFYWLGSALFGVGLATARVLSINDYTPEYWKDPASWWRIFGAAILVYITVHVSLGTANARLAKQVALAEAARTALEIQRGRLITNGEEIRRQIADFLHDRLQSDLVLLGLQMQKAVEKLESDQKAIAQAYIDEIERIRQFDVRSVSRQLAPELDGPSLHPALEELLGRYQKAFRATLEISETGELSKPAKLASYRIVEQALLNAAKHGAPKNVWVVIEESNSVLTIKVTNDGKLFEKKPTAGAGFAMFDDWTKQFKGSWSLRADGKHSVLEATLHL